MRERCTLRRRPLPARLRGQVLPLMVVLLLICCACFYFMVNTNQVVAEKQRVLNVADAAAYSAGVVQARALNYAAYANRAVIANQVLIAQTLSILDFLNYGMSLYTATDADGYGIRDLGKGIEWAAIPSDPEQQERYLKIAALGAGSLIAQFYGYDPADYVEILDPAQNFPATIIISRINGASFGLEQSVRSILGLESLTLLERTRQAAVDAAHEVDPKISAHLFPLPHGVASIVKLYDGDDRTRAQDMVLRSLDEEVKKREWDAVSHLHDPPWLEPGLFRRGSTWMPDLDHWRASDRLYYRGIKSGWLGKSLGRKVDIAKADAVIGPQDGPEARFWDRLADHDDQMESSSYFRAWYSGMASLYDIADPSSTEPTQHRASIVVSATKRKADTLTAGSAARISPAGELALFDGRPEVDRLGGLGRAEILFDRPPRPDGTEEFPNLFNPYWTVRLSSPTAGDYAAYAAAEAIRVMR